MGSVSMMSATDRTAMHDLAGFEPAKHLAFSEPSKIFKMEDIGFSNDIGVSSVAVTQPFQLFSPEAIQTMRSEIAKPGVSKNHTFNSNLAANGQLRGYARDHASFTYAVWNHPETIAIVSKLAAIDLDPWGD
jgi:hypothetical protein